MPDPNPVTAYLAERDAPCPGCGYNLRGLRSSFCPECGRHLQEAGLLDRKPTPMLAWISAWLDTLWIIVLFALSLVACLSLVQLVFLGRPHHGISILLNAIMGTVGGAVPLLLRKHGKAWTDLCGPADLKTNLVLALLTVFAAVSRFVAFAVLRV